jgi:hypothetical protein
MVHPSFAMARPAAKNKKSPRLCLRGQEQFGLVLIFSVVVWSFTLE